MNYFSEGNIIFFKSRAVIKPIITRIHIGIQPKTKQKLNTKKIAVMCAKVLFVKRKIGKQIIAKRIHVAKNPPAKTEMFKA